MNKKRLHSLGLIILGIILALTLFIIFRPIFYTFLFFGITFLVYALLNKKVSRRIAFLDSILIHSFIVLPVVWFSLPKLAQLIFANYQRTLNPLLLKLLLQYVLSDVPSHFFRIVFLIVVLILIFKIINIIDAWKLRKYDWVIFMIILFPTEIIYYFLIGRDMTEKDIKRKNRST